MVSLSHNSADLADISLPMWKAWLLDLAWVATRAVGTPYRSQHWPEPHHLVKRECAAMPDEIARPASRHSVVQCVWAIPIDSIQTCAALVKGIAAVGARVGA